MKSAAFTFSFAIRGQHVPETKCVSSLRRDPSAYRCDGRGRDGFVEESIRRREPKRFDDALRSHAPHRSVVPSCLPAGSPEKVSDYAGMHRCRRAAIAQQQWATAGRLSMPRPFKPDLEQGTTSPEQLMRGGRRWPSQAKESISSACTKWERHRRERLVKAAERSLKKQLLDIDRCLAALKLKHQKHSK